MNFYDHPAFSGVDKNFLASLEQKVGSLSGKDTTEVLTALVAITNEARRYQVQFTPERQQILIEHLRNNLPIQKRKQFDALVGMMQKSTR
jgi:hypothetical protein